MKRRKFLELGTGSALGGALGACGSRSSGDARGGGQAAQVNVMSGWTGAALQAVRQVRPGPPMAARSLAVVYTCLYNTWCAYDATALPTAPAVLARRPPAERTEANKAAALSFAAHAALADQFPAAQAIFDQTLRLLGYDPAAARGVDSQPAAIGTAVAGAEIAWCHTDGSNQLGNLTPSGVPYADYTGYAPRNPPLVVGAPTPPGLIADPGHWQPLSYVDATGVVRTQGYLGAAWGQLRPFALDSASQLRPGPPAAPGTSAYLDQARHIVEVQAALSDEQKVIAEYWSDGPGTDLPPGHWIRFALEVSQRDGHSMDDDVRLFFALSNALGDAAIAAWDAKRAYDSERPITAVRYALQGQTITGYGMLGPAGGLRQILGEEWTPYQPLTFPTPPFPEHVSGHSSFSTAAAEVLRSFTGSDAFGAGYTASAHSTTIAPGAPAAELSLIWPTFSAAAEQAGMSRVYGGIHFDNANAAGLSIGRRAGAQAFAKARALWQGAT